LLLTDHKKNLCPRKEVVE